MPLRRVLRIALVIPIVASALSAQQRPVRGTVFLDRNANGVRDANERGIRGIVVSNQDDVALTDSAGGYAFRAAPTGIVFVSVPDGFRAIGRFWHTTAVDSTFDFPLA